MGGYLKLKPECQCESPQPNPTLESLYRNNVCDNKAANAEPGSSVMLVLSLQKRVVSYLSETTQQNLNPIILVDIVYLTAVVI